jgi:hypothetical protein
MAVLSAIVSLACVLASVRRLVLAVSTSTFDPELLARALKHPQDLARLRQGLDAGKSGESGESGESWEMGLVSAALLQDADARAALIDEQVLEADWSSQRWAPVPRVCASIATSAGFLCASVVLIQALTAGSEEVTGAALVSALDALALGIAGASFCAAVHLRLRSGAKTRRASADRLIERVRQLASAQAPSSTPSPTSAPTSP